MQFPTGARATRCYERCGFKRPELFRENSCVRGRYVDVAPMGITRLEFERG
jgi:RimJ/RimL family protein N-acetyltransferase